MFDGSSKNMAVCFIVTINVAVTTRVSVNQKGADLFIKGISKKICSFLVYRYTINDLKQLPSFIAKRSGGDCVYMSLVL